MSAEREEGGFLERWSARKRRADAADPTAPEAGSPARDADAEPSRASDAPDGGARVVAAPDPTGASPGQEAATGERVEARGAAPDPDPGSGAEEPAGPPPLTDVDMPPIESLDATSDLSGFFSKGVSASLRRAALRHVFSRPSYNVRDGLNDYDGNYTVFEPLGDTVTSDMKFHAARRERERLRREAEAEVDGRIETSSADETRSTNDTATDGAEPDDTEPDRSVAEAERGSSTAERDPAAEAGEDGEREGGAVPQSGTASREGDGTSLPGGGAADAGDGLSSEERVHRGDVFRDGLASNGTDGRPLNGTRADADEDEDAGHG